uniref:Myosin IXA n=1 Tax=Myripristis murdjan TaxID=586833 RepID=A0A668A9N9_9TELE
MSARDGDGGIGGMGTLGRRQRFENSEFTVRIYPGALAEGTIYCPVSARKTTTAAEAIERVIERLHLDRTKCYVLAEVKEFGGEEWILNPTDCPVQRMMLWPRVALEQRSFSGGEDYRFLLRQKNLDGSIHYGGSLQMWLRVTEERRRMVERGLLPQPEPQGDHADLCRLPELNERSLLDNLRSRFRQEKIYTYVGSILIVINPFKFLPIYNPKYVKIYDNHSLGELEPHIYAVADVAYHAMLQRQRNQCIVISGESGSGKTQSTNFLIHHLTALSQKGFASGVEQIILGAGPVLEAFGNAKTAHNNNSSRFGKFIQVNYHESGTVRGAYVEKYLLEKSRLVYQEHNERNYHVFYYLLAGTSEEERTAFHLKKPEEYHYLNQDCFTVEGEDLKHDFERLQLAMEMVGFLPATRKQIFSLLSAILHLGNIRYKRKTYRDDSIDICNPEVLPVVSELLEVKEEMLFEALTTRKTVTVGERLIVPYRLAEAGTVRDSMAKSLYSALFDWIVFRINHALLSKKDLEESTKILSIGVLDIFGFEDYESNSFEQFCINFANERLQHYFNQHIFKLEQEEYRAEGISWHNIDYIDNTGCINLISKKPTALLHLLDEECNFPQATNQTLLDKFKRQHEGSSYIEFPAVMEPAFIIQHYAGKVKYGIKDFREKNTDHMRPDIVALLKSSKNAFICGLIGIDPSATFRWAVLRAYFRALVAFREAGKRHTQKKTGERSHSQKLCGDTCSTNLYLFFNRRNKNYKSKPVLPKHLLDVKSLKYLSNLTLHDRITKSLLHLHKKKKPPSISAQFQASLNKLMETLGQSEPYFVKCIRSNADKVEYSHFGDDALVLRQLRYTGMLETVRIRQSGYNIKYTFKDFVHHYRVLLPEDTKATQESIQRYLDQQDLAPAGYQVGRTMVFFREAERQQLQASLHKEVLRLIVALQQRFRARLERRQFLRMRDAAICIQRAWRLWLYRRCTAALVIQTAWRCHQAREAYLRLYDAVVQLQAVSRGYLARQSMQKETPLSEELSDFIRPPVELRDEAAQTGELTPSPQKGGLAPLPQSPVPVSTPVPQANQAVLEKLVRLNEEKEERQRNQQQQNEKEMMEQIRQQKEVLERQRLFFAQYERDMFEKQRGEALHRIQQSRQGAASAGQDVFGTATSSKPLRPSSLLIERKLALAPHARTHSDSTAPSKQSTPGVDIQGTAPQPQLPPPASSAPKERLKEGRPVVDGWAPKLTLESRDRGGTRVRAHTKKAPGNQGTTVNMTDKPGNIFFSPKDRVTFVEEHNGHIFKSTQYSIPTYCEYCSSLIWMMDRACVCKCECACKYQTIFITELSSRQFGVEVSRLTSDERTVPLVVEKLINYIEMHGLYTEGIYRKSGSANKIKELKQGLDTDVDNMNLDDYNIHVIASVFKQWLRDLPNPLMTFELYEEFLRAMGLQDKKEVIRGVYSVIDQLSKTHLSTLERLIFHLVRIALQEETNRMSANALAIVFAPCILRCPDTIDPLQSVQDIGKTTACVELIIGEQMNKYRARLKDISSLEFAENKAKCRLTFIRRSMVNIFYNYLLLGAFSAQTRGNNFQTSFTVFIVHSRCFCVFFFFFFGLNLSVSISLEPCSRKLKNLILFSSFSFRTMSGSVVEAHKQHIF